MVRPLSAFFFSLISLFLFFVSVRPILATQFQAISPPSHPTSCLSPVSNPSTVLPGWRPPATVLSCPLPMADRPHGDGPRPTDSPDRLPSTTPSPQKRSTDFFSSLCSNRYRPRHHVLVRGRLPERQGRDHRYVLAVAVQPAPLTRPRLPGLARSRRCPGAPFVGASVEHRRM